MSDFCPHAKSSVFDPDRFVCLNPDIHFTRCIHADCPLINRHPKPLSHNTNSTYDHPSLSRPLTSHLSTSPSETQLSLF